MGHARWCVLDQRQSNDDKQDQFELGRRPMFADELLPIDNQKYTTGESY